MQRARELALRPLDFSEVWLVHWPLCDTNGFQVERPRLYRRNVYQPILNPFTGGQSFGVVSSVVLASEVFPKAEIHLFHGKHIGPNRGFGACHIWAEHKLEMARAGYGIEDEVAAYVAQIVREGTPLYFEGASYRTTRLLAVRSQRGMAVLEFRDQRAGPIGSVVTAYSASKTHGTRVGTVR